MLAPPPVCAAAARCGAAARVTRRTLPTLSDITSAQKFIVGLGERVRADERAGVVDEHIEAAEEFRRLGRPGVAFLGLGEVGAGAGVAATERWASAASSRAASALLR
jgi:hypothetical protein